MAMTFEEAQAAQQAAETAAPPADSTAAAPAKTSMSFEEAQAAQLASEGGSASQPYTYGQMAKEAGKGLASGVVSGGASLVRGGADLVDMGIRRAGGSGAPDLGVTAAADAAEQATNKAMAPAPGWEDSYTRKISEGLGQFAPIGAAAMVPGIGTAVAVGTGALQGTDAMHQRAVQAGAGQDATDEAMIGGGAIGAITGLIPGAGGLLAKLGPAAAKGVVGYALRTAAAAGAGGGIGALTSAFNDAVEKYTINPDKVIGEGALSDGTMMALVAGIFHGTAGELHRAATMPKPAPTPEAPLDLTQRQLALPAPGPTEMTPEEIAIAQAKARTTPSAPVRPGFAGDESKPATDPLKAATAAQARAAAASRFSPEGDTLNVTPAATDAQGNPVETGTPGTGGTAFRPDQLTPEDLALITKHYSDRTPAEIAGMVPDAQQFLLRMAKTQEEAQQKLDALGGMRVTDTSGEGRTSPPSRANGHPDRPRGDQPLDSEIERGDDVGPYARSGTGTSDRPFRGDGTDNASPDQAAQFEQQARDQAEAKRKAKLDDLMREWAERENAERNRAKQEEEAAQSKQNAGGRRPFADAEEKYADTPATKTPKGLDGDGNYHVDGDGFVMSTKGGPIRFMSAKEAGRWIIDHGHAKSATQVFEIANHPGQRGGFTVRETMRTKPEEKAAPGAEPGAQQPGAETPPPNTEPKEPLALTGPKEEAVKGTPEPPPEKPAPEGAGKPAEGEKPAPAPEPPTAEKPPTAPPGNERVPVHEGNITYLDPAEIGTDAKTFQFRSAQDDRGTSGRLKGVTKWEPTLADPLIVYKDENGKHWVADGHHRLALAQDLNARGNGPGKIPAFVLDAKDGYTPGKARFLAAFKNLAGGHGDATDAAKVIREANRAGPGVELPQLPDTALVRQGRALASLSDEAFGLVVAGKVEPDHAALVPEYFKDPAEQVAAIHGLMQIGPHNVMQARSVLADIKEAGIVHGTTEDMFGSHNTAASLIGERARVLDSAIRSLRLTAKVFGAAAGGHDILSDAGNKLNREGNVKGKNDSDVLIAHLAADGNRKGPISDALRAAAQALKDGKSVKGAAADFLVQARKIIRQGNHGDVSARADRGGGGDAAEAPKANEIERPHGTDSIKTAQGQETVHLLGGEFAKWLSGKMGQFANHFDAAKAWLVERGRATDNEHMLVYDAATGQFVSAITSQRAHFVVPSKALHANMFDPTQRLVTTHNHPQNSAASPGDLSMLAYPGVSTMVTVGHDGKVTAARLHPDAVAVLHGFSLGSFSDRLMNHIYRIHDEHNALHLPDRLFEMTDLLNRALARAEIIDYVSTRDIAGDHDAQNLDTYRQFLEIALEERARLGLPELAETINVRNDRFGRSQSDAEATAFVHQAGRGATGLPAEDHGLEKWDVGTQAAPGDGRQGSRNDLTQSEPDYSGPWISNKDNQGRLFETKKPDMFDKTDQGDQRVIPGAEKLTPEQVAARAKAERDAKMLAARQLQSKMRSGKPQQEAGGLFGGDKPKQGGLFDEMSPRADELRRKTREREESYPQHTQDSIKQWAGDLDDRNVAQRIQDGITHATPGFFDRFYQAVVDRRWTPSEREVTKLGLRNAADLNAHGEVRAAASAHDAAAFADRSATAVEQMWTHGPLKMVNGLFKTVDWRDRNGRLIDGYKGVLRPVGKAGLIREYATYERIIRARRLAGEGRDQQYNGARDEATRRDLETRYPFFKDVHAEMQRLNKANLQPLVESGVKTQAQVDALAKYADYSPFYRQLVNESGIKGPGKMGDELTNQSAFRKLKGGDAQIGEYLGNITRNAQSIAAVAMKNLAADRYVRDEEALGMATRMHGNPIEMEHMDNVVRIYRNGEAQYWKIDNKMTFNALKGLDGHPINAFTKFLGVPARLLRTMTTHSPVFLAFNHPIRESIVGAFTGRKGGIKPITSAYQGMWEVLHNSDLTQELRHHMIGGGFDIAGGEGKAAKSIMGSYAQEANNAAGLARKVWHQYEKLIEAADLGVRTQIYKKEMAAHGDEWEASKAALSNGVNFKQRGSSEILKMASIAIPFLNARIQGLDTLGRAAVRQPGLSAKRALILGGLTAAYYAYVQGNPLYQRAPDQLKDDNWLIPVGDTLVRAPAPFELGVIIKRSVEHFMRYMTGDDTPADTRAAIFRAVLDTFKFNPIPQAFLPAVQTAFNYDTFTAQPVEKHSVEHLQKAARFDDKTSEIAKGIGKVTGPSINLSPMQIDHLVKGYFGTIGDYALQASNAIIRTAQGGPARPATGATDAPGISSIVKTSRNIGSAQVGQFYEMKHQVDELVATVHKMQQQGNAAGASELVKNNKALYGMQGYTKSVGAALSQIHKAEGAVRDGKGSPEEKRAALDKLDARRQQALGNVNTMRRRAAG